MTIPPTEPKIYHILHIDKLSSVANDGYLLSDAKMIVRTNTGTSIGMNKIKHRRLTELRLPSYPALHVGDCVPFYFCPRSVMLYIIHKKNNLEVTYKGGEEPIIHLEANFHEAVAWAKSNNKQWVFTLTNAGSRIFEDRTDINQLDAIRWSAVNARDWSKCVEEKQSEFLIEERFPWELIRCIGVCSTSVRKQTEQLLSGQMHAPLVHVKRDWYYGENIYD